MDHKEIFGALCSSRPVPPTCLPDTFGIYALWDHANQIRYIGSTPKATEGFRVRVGSKHVTGSESRSHKFSHAYCTGRMWRFCKKLDWGEALAFQDPVDAKMAKRLRTLFIRRYCHVTYVEVPQEENGYFSYLTSLEREVQRMAPKSMRVWDGVNFSRFEEPVELVDKIIGENPSLKEAAERQKKVFERYAA